MRSFLIRPHDDPGTHFIWGTAKTTNRLFLRIQTVTFTVKFKLAQFIALGRPCHFHIWLDAKCGNDAGLDSHLLLLDGKPVVPFQLQLGKFGCLVSAIIFGAKLLHLTHFSHNPAVAFG